LIDKTCKGHNSLLNTDQKGPRTSQTPEYRGSGTLPSEVTPFLLGPISRPLGALESRASLGPLLWPEFGGSGRLGHRVIAVQISECV